MSEWKKVKLGEMLLVKKGDYITKKEAKEGKYPVILGGKEPAYFIDKYNHTGKAIVISRSGASAGYVSFWNEPIFVTDGFLIEPKGDVIFEFLYYVLKSKQRELHNTQKGAAIPHVTPALIGEVEGFLPDLQSQQRIINILSRYDSLIENYRKQIKLLEEAAKWLYKEWFVELRFPGHENTKIVDGVPEGWEKKSVLQLGDYLNGFAFKPSDWQETGKPIIKIKEMGNGVTDETPRNNGERVPEKYLVKAGDLLFSWSATLMVIVWTGEDGWLNQHLFKVTPAKGIGREFLLQTISNAILEFSNLTTGSTMKHIQRNKLDQVFVNVPSSDMMEKYNDIAESLRTKVINVSAQIHLLSEARDRLLPKLMSGKMNVILENYPAV